MKTHRALLISALAALALLPGCAPQPPAPEKPATAPSPDAYPRDFYEKAAVRGEPVYRVNPKRSLVVIEVRRAGSLARLGHDHVVAARNVTGFAAPGAARADLYVALDELTVDEPGLRKAAGFDSQPSESDIAGTRANMLERVLETKKYPNALVRVDEVAGRLAVSITLHGVTRKLEVPASIEKNDRQIGVSGRLALKQSDFGITPYSILGGAIAVRDQLELRFDVHADRMR